jgi:hypothetical protein
MKKETGWLTAALFTATLGIGIRSFQSTPASIPGGGGEKTVGASKGKFTTPEKPAQKPKTPGEAVEDGPCGDLEAQLQAFFDADTIAAPASCQGRNKDSYDTGLSSQTRNMQFAIAVVPDPLHTHFSLTFDRYAEAMQQGAQDQGYLYDSSWMPWDTESESYPLLDDKLKDEDQTKKREEQPGIILFRRQRNPDEPISADAPYGRGLAIFVVGEEATAGVHRQQFENALAWITLLQGGGLSDLKIIGPSFSGSLSSLAQMLISQWQAPSHPYPISVFSGGITSKQSASDFVDHLKLQTNAVGSKVNISFQSFEQSDDYQIENYCRYLSDAGTSTMERVAVISEDETSYGGNLENDKSLHAAQPPPKASCDSLDGMELTNLYYPRDISALRAAYQSQSLFTSSAANSSPDAARRTLKTDLADPEGHQHDTIRSYSGTQTALSQESELQQIVRKLKSHRSEYILLRSSNPLDEIFLANYLQQQYPEGRIVVTSADLLLARDMNASGLAGVMTLSNYPLIPAEQDWTSPQAAPHTHRAFTNSEAEGTYIATRVMLGAAAAGGTGAFTPGLCDASANVEIRDYSDPFWISSEPTSDKQKPSCHQPPTWIAVLGRGGYWPVADMGAPEANCRRCEHIFGIVKSIFFLRILREHYAESELTTRGLAIPASLTITLIVVFLWSIFHLWCCSNPTITLKPGFFAHFARAPFSQPRAKAHLTLMVAGSALIGIVPSILGWGMGAHSAGMEISVNIIPYRILLTLIWVIGLISIAANVWIEARLQILANATPPRNHPAGVMECIWPPSPSFRQRGSTIWRVVRKPCLAYFFATFLIHTLLIVCLEPRLHPYNRVATYIRSMNITSGVSPIAPLLIIVAGLYCWFWFTLQGQAVLGEDRPLLPTMDDLKMAMSKGGRKRDLLTMLSREQVAQPVEGWCDWVSGDVGITFAFLFVGVLMVCCIVEFPPLRSLGSSDYSGLCFTLIAFCAALLLTNTWQVLRIWFLLRHLLATLDRLPLRRTIHALRGFSWGSIWTMGGGVLDERYKLYSRQVECLTHLKQVLARVESESIDGAEILHARTGLVEMDDVQDYREKFWVWYSQHWSDWGARDPGSIQRHVQEAFAAFSATLIIDVLLPAWNVEADSLIADRSHEERKSQSFSVEHVAPHILAAEEFVCLVYLGFIQNVLGRVRSLVSGIIFLFVALALGITTYPFDPRPLLNGFIVVLFLVLGFFIFTVYAEMFRDATLSRLTDTNPGELGSEFWLKVIGFGVGPVFSLLASIFPAFANFFFSWMQPGVSSLK